MDLFVPTPTTTPPATPPSGGNGADLFSIEEEDTNDNVFIVSQLYSPSPPLPYSLTHLLAHSHLPPPLPPSLPLPPTGT